MKARTGSKSSMRVGHVTFSKKLCVLEAVCPTQINPSVAGLAPAVSMAITRKPSHLTDQVVAKEHFTGSRTAFVVVLFLVVIMVGHGLLSHRPHPPHL